MHPTLTDWNRWSLLALVLPPGINILRWLLLCNCTWCCSLIQRGFGCWWPVVTWSAGAGDVRSFRVTWYVWALSCWWEKKNEMEIMASFGIFFGVKKKKSVFPPWTWVLILIFKIYESVNPDFVLCHNTPCVHGVRWCLPPPLPPGAQWCYVTFPYHFMKYPPLKWAWNEEQQSFCVTVPGWNCVYLSVAFSYFIQHLHKKPVKHTIFFSQNDPKWITYGVVRQDISLTLHCS